MREANDRASKTVLQTVSQFFRRIRVWFAQKVFGAPKALQISLSDEIATLSSLVSTQKITRSDLEDMVKKTSDTIAKLLKTEMPPVDKLAFEQLQRDLGALLPEPLLSSGSVGKEE